MLKRLFSDPTDLMDLKNGVLKGMVFSPPRETDKPTYELVGPVERVDGRDITFSRMALKAETPFYDEYYSRHPERKAGDDERRRIADEDLRSRTDDGAVTQQLGVAPFLGIMPLSRPDVVENRLKTMNAPNFSRPDDAKLDVSPEEATNKIKAFALHLGASKVRIARLNQDWVYSHDRRGEPVNLDYKYIVCMTFLHDPFMLESKGVAVSFEIGWRYSYASFVSLILANYVRDLGWPARPLPTGNSNYLVVPSFIDAGIGEQGRCGFVVAKEFGNSWRPGAVVTDIPLVIDKPVDFGLQDFCQKCQICADMCPAGAIPKEGKMVVRGVRRWSVDAEKCDASRLKRKTSCAICQAVCPWNHPNNLFHKSVRELATSSAFMRDLLVKAEKALHPPRVGKPLPGWMRKAG